jgi:hypothetical protein
LAPREAPRGQALDVRVLQRDLQNLHIEKAEIGKKLLSEINDEDINLWKLEIEGKRTPQKKPLSTRRKNMSLDVLCQIFASPNGAAWRTTSF